VNSRLDFVEALRFDRVGTFQFSFEAGTPSEPLGDPIPPEVKEERYNRLMELQHGISLAINQTFVGQTLPVLIEGQDQPTPGPQAAGILVGRSYRDAPEIDGVVVVEAARQAGKPAEYYASTDQTLIGKIVPVRITGALAYDLNGILDFPET
jgi:ribosomal protein S12 methylthiotransferase